MRAESLLMDGENRFRFWLVVGIFAVAAAIVFHGWWPPYKAERDLQRYVEKCLEDSDKFKNACIKEYYFIYSDRMR